jgi:hypothetical protein
MAPTLSKPVFVSLGVALGVCLKEKRKPKKKWSKRWLVDRKKYAAANLLMELGNKEPRDFQNYLRMDNELFQNLLRVVKPRIEKKEYGNEGNCKCRGKNFRHITVFSYRQQLRRL